MEALINDSCDLDMRELLKKMSKPMKDRVTAREALDIVESKKTFTAYFCFEKNQILLLVGRVVSWVLRSHPT